MKGYSGWSYDPYKPLLFEVGEIYIARLVPSKNAVHVEWHDTPDEIYRVFVRQRGEETFTLFGETKKNEIDITGLTPDTDYELYVAAGEKRSRVRLARAGEMVGTVVNYLHPDDTAYAFSGRYLCSPCVLRHPEGHLLASMDVYGWNHPQNLTMIFRSDDDGKTWHHLCDLMPCFWGRMFMHGGALYMIGCSTEYGDVLIGRSEDGGRSFGTPSVLARGSGGKEGNTGWHKNPQPLHIQGDRLYLPIEWGSWQNGEYGHAAVVMSCPKDCDLLVPENWHFSEPRPFDYFTEELSDLEKPVMTIEGTLVTAPDGRLLNAMRFGKYQKSLVYEVNTSDPDAPLSYSHCMDFPGNFSKFMIRYDAVSGQYYSIVCRVYDREKPWARDLASLVCSKDLLHWQVVLDLFDYRNYVEDSYKKIGFQYVDFFFEGEDILFLSRTALNGANDFHNSNSMTFHRIKSFRSAEPTLI